MLYFSITAIRILIKRKNENYTLLIRNQLHLKNLWKHIKHIFYIARYICFNKSKNFKNAIFSEKSRHD